METRKEGKKGKEKTRRTQQATRGRTYNALRDSGLKEEKESRKERRAESRVDFIVWSGLVTGRAVGREIEKG